jgi:hypothetical protein
VARNAPGRPLSRLSRTGRGPRREWRTPHRTPDSAAPRRRSSRIEHSAAGLRSRRAGALRGSWRTDSADRVGPNLLTSSASSRYDCSGTGAGPICVLRKFGRRIRPGAGGDNCVIRKFPSRLRKGAPRGGCRPADLRRRSRGPIDGGESVRVNPKTRRGRGMDRDRPLADRPWRAADACYHAPARLRTQANGRGPGGPRPWREIV